MPRLGIGMPLVATATEAAVLTIDDFVWDIVSSSNLNPLDTSGTLNDTSNIWDYDGTNIMPEVDPDSEGVWERPSNIVLNHDYADLGANVVINGDFDADSGWDRGTGWTISGGSANCDGSQTGNSNLTPNADNVENGLLYRVTYSISNYSSGSIRIKLGNTGFGQFNSGNGTYTEEIKAVVTTFPRSQINADSSFIGSIDNISVKQIDPNDRWTLSGTTISNGVLNFPDNSSAAHHAFQDNVLTEGNTYEITLTVTRTSGRLEILAGTGGTGVISNINTSGTHTFTFDYSGISGTRIWIYSSASGNFIGTIDNVTVKEYAITPLDV